MKRRIYDQEGHAQFVTFSCFHRRRLLDHPQLRDMFVATLAEKLNASKSSCCGYVVMPDHVHVILWFPEPNTLSVFMKAWKQTSSLRLKKLARGIIPQYLEAISAADPFWQAKYYSFSLYSEAKAREKLDYVHLNPVRGVGRTRCRLAMEFGQVL